MASRGGQEGTTGFPRWSGASKYSTTVRKLYYTCVLCTLHPSSASFDSRAQIYWTFVLFVPRRSPHEPTYIWVMFCSALACTHHPSNISSVKPKTRKRQNRKMGVFESSHSMANPLYAPNPHSPGSSEIFDPCRRWPRADDALLAPSWVGASSLALRPTHTHPAVCYVRDHRAK